MSRLTRSAAWLVGVLGLGLAALMIPLPEQPLPPAAGGQPFLWRQDERFAELERRFVAARQRPKDELEAAIRSQLAEVEALCTTAEGDRLPAGDNLWPGLEAAFFAAAPLVAAAPKHLDELASLQARLRAAAKQQSRSWDMDDPKARDRLYRLLYGSRAALEEAVLQSEPGQVPAVLHGADEPSRTPFLELAGVTVHSGDLLLSRGNAPTSALIARGNDYPGNFSHVALLDVDETGNGRLLEAHIEGGAAVATPEQYLADVKLRILLLRPRADLPALLADPLLPHRAATRAYREITRRHIPYDFAMDFSDPAKLFCSEVASWAYRAQGLTLWMGISRISSPGVAAWLAAFGVRHMVTQEPSDLEYDPQLVVVAEWRDLEALWQDHVDNAVVEAMLEGAERGERLDYSRLALPAARLAKAWSVLMNACGRRGPVPEGMSAAAALRHRAFVRRHTSLRDEVLTRAEAVRRQQGYRPPYWELLRLARTAADARAE